MNTTDAQHAADWLAARIAFAEAELARPQADDEELPPTHITALIRIRPTGAFQPYGDAEINVDQLRALLNQRIQLRDMIKQERAYSRELHQRLIDTLQELDRLSQHPAAAQQANQGPPSWPYAITVSLLAFPISIITASWIPDRWWSLAAFLIVQFGLCSRAGWLYTKLWPNGGTT